MIGRKLAQIDLVTAGDVLEKIVDPQLHLRLAHLFLPALIVQLVQRIPHRAQFRFQSIDGGEAAGAFVQNRGHILLRRFQLRGLNLERSLRLFRLDCLQLEPALVVADITAAGVNQFRQFLRPRRHRLALAEKIFAALTLRRDLEAQTLEQLPGFLFVHSRLFARFGSSRFSRLLFADAIR